MDTDKPSVGKNVLLANFLLATSIITALGGLFAALNSLSEKVQKFFVVFRGSAYGYFYFRAADLRCCFAPKRCASSAPIRSI
jgi:hypothetical protein